MKRKLSMMVALCLVLIMALTVVGCGKTSQKDDGKLTIGIVQIIEHPSLNTIRESMVAELAAWDTRMARTSPLIIKTLKTTKPT